MWLDEMLFRRILREMTETVAGQRWILTQLADAEATACDEGGLFDRVIAVTPFPKLARLVARHKADEKRHEAAVRSALARLGGPADIPGDLLLLHIAEDLMGVPPDREVRGARDVVDVYSFIGVLERRAVRQMEDIAAAFAGVDDDVAAMLRGLAADEARHVGWCEVVVAAHAEAAGVDPAPVRRRFDRLDALAYHLHNRRGTPAAFDRGLLRGGPLRRAAWTALTSVWCSVFEAWVRARERVRPDLCFRR